MDASEMMSKDFSDLGMSLCCLAGRFGTVYAVSRMADKVQNFVFSLDNPENEAGVQNIANQSLVNDEQESSSTCDYNTNSHSSNSNRQNKIKRRKRKGKFCVIKNAQKKAKLMKLASTTSQNSVGTEDTSDSGVSVTQSGNEVENQQNPLGCDENVRVEIQSDSRPIVVDDQVDEAHLANSFSTDNILNYPVKASVRLPSIHSLPLSDEIVYENLFKLIKSSCWGLTFGKRINSNNYNMTMCQNVENQETCDESLPNNGGTVANLQKADPLATNDNAKECDLESNLSDSTNQSSVSESALSDSTNKCSDLTVSKCSTRSLMSRLLSNTDLSSKTLSNNLSSFTNSDKITPSTSSFDNIAPTPSTSISNDKRLLRSGRNYAVELATSDDDSSLDSEPNKSSCLEALERNHALEIATSDDNSSLDSEPNESCLEASGSNHVQNSSVESYSSKIEESAPLNWQTMKSISLSGLNILKFPFSYVPRGYQFKWMRNCNANADLQGHATDTVAKRGREDDTLENSSLSKKLKLDLDWSCMPPELLVNILGRLSDADRCRARLVCSHWDSVFKVPALWHHCTFYFCGSPGEGQRAITFLKTLGSHLRHVTVILAGPTNAAQSQSSEAGSSSGSENEQDREAMDREVARFFSCEAINQATFLTFRLNMTSPVSPQITEAICAMLLRQKRQGRAHCITTRVYFKSCCFILLGYKRVDSIVFTRRDFPSRIGLPEFPSDIDSITEGQEYFSKTVAKLKSFVQFLLNSIE